MSRPPTERRQHRRFTVTRAVSLHTGVAHAVGNTINLSRGGVLLTAPLRPRHDGSLLFGFVLGPSLVCEALARLQRIARRDSFAFAFEAASASFESFFSDLERMRFDVCVDLLAQARDFQLRAA